jgi:hypothetical protein
MSGRLGVGASRVVRNEAESDIILVADEGSVTRLMLTATSRAIVGA